MNPVPPVMNSLACFRSSHTSPTTSVTNSRSLVNDQSESATIPHGTFMETRYSWRPVHDARSCAFWSGKWPGNLPKRRFKCRNNVASNLVAFRHRDQLEPSVTARNNDAIRPGMVLLVVIELVHHQAKIDDRRVCLNGAEQLFYMASQMINTGQ